MSNSIKITLIILLLIVLVGVSEYFRRPHITGPVDTPVPTQQVQREIPEKKEPEIKNLSFTCSDDTSGLLTFNIPKKTLTVKMTQDTYNLVLATSASGSRYTNEDESFVFWEKGGTAFIERRGDVVHEDCVVK